jgi:hypothetical protein
MSQDAASFIVSAQLGSRLVVRKRIDDGFSDALGYLRACTETECVIETKRGLVTIPLSEVVAAKEVPPPPAPRARRPPPAD